MNHPKKYILPLIITSQFACTSLWFAGNVVINDLAEKASLGSEALGHVLSAVQFGFIVGTLAFALLMIADRYSPSKVFLISALLASLCNYSLVSEITTPYSLMIARFGTGFFLAGIYPVGMKIAADYYVGGLGKALGYLVGALVLGTAFPHLIKALELGTDYKTIISITSGLAVSGGLLLGFLVPDGPFRKASQKLELKVTAELFRIKEFRRAALGYFGHMWELYAFWTFVPFALSHYSGEGSMGIAIWSFMIISVGFVSCIIGGNLSLRVGSTKVARMALIISGVCCLISPFVFQLPKPLFLFILCVWGATVIADSPLFSTLVAGAAPSMLKGTGLTIVNCIGFSVSILSIELLSFLFMKIDTSLIFLPLFLGPLLGVVNLFNKKVVTKT